MAKTQEPFAGVTPEPAPDLLAAVVLHTLVSGGPGRGIDPGARTNGLTLAQVARACERDPARPDEAREVQAALDILVADDLATREGKRYRPTRAAIRAAELSF
ncbi:MAG: hypothetical protein ACRDK4_01045 [Solirubrobacteraceae bacterium]